MNSLEIKINIKKIKDYSASLLRSMDKETLLLIIESFSRYVLELYGALIEEAINSNRYKGVWEPIEDEAYREYLGTKPSGDILLYIRDALEIVKIGYNYVIRINPKYRYPGSDLYLSTVIRAIDGGTSKFNSRPILSRIVKDINSNIINLYRGYLTIKGVI